MKFSNRTTYDEERLLRYHNFLVLRKRFFWSVVIICTVLISIIFALTLIFDPYNSSIWFSFIFIWTLDMICVFCYFILPHITISKAPQLNTNVLFEFEDNVFKIYATAKSGNESSERNYQSLIKVMESKQDIYLFISQRQAYILNKSCFTVGTSEDFLKFLKSKGIPCKGK